MIVRFRFALPFAVLTSLVVGCSSSSSGTSSTDSGTPKEGGTTTKDAGKDSATTADGGAAQDASKDTGAKKDAVSTGFDAGAGSTPAPGSITINKGLTATLGLTDEDYLAYYDNTGGVSVADITGKVTQVLKGSDAGAANTYAGVVGKFVWTWTDVVTKTVQGNAVPISGTFSIWTKELGTLTQIATNSGAYLGIAADSSYIFYSDSLNSAGTVGNIGVVAADGTTNKKDLLVGVNVDTASTTCYPYVSMDKGFVVVSYCGEGDGGSTPTIASFNSASSWAETVLATKAGASSLAAAPYAVNYATDTAGINLLTLSGATPNVLSIQPLGSATQTTVASPIGTVTGGAEYFYLSTDSTYAVYTQPSGALEMAKFATPSALAAPTITKLDGPAGDGGTGSVYGVLGVSGDGKYLIEYDSAPDPTTTAPTSLNLINLSATPPTKTVVSAPGNGNVSTFYGTNNFTTDYSYLVYTSGLKAVANSTGTVGTLMSYPVAGGSAVTLVSTPNVWDANMLTGTKLIYNSNYTPSLFTSAPNGAASGDIYIADASKAGPGTLFITQADALSSQGFYVTKDKTHLFYSFTQLAVGDGGVGVSLPGNGLYVVALP